MGLAAAAGEHPRTAHPSIRRAAMAAATSVILHASAVPPWLLPHPPRLWNGASADTSQSPQHGAAGSAAPHCLALGLLTHRASHPPQRALRPATLIPPAHPHPSPWCKPRTPGHCVGYTGAAALDIYARDCLTMTRGAGALHNGSCCMGKVRGTKACLPGGRRRRAATWQCKCAGAAWTVVGLTCRGCGASGTEHSSASHSTRGTHSAAAPDVGARAHTCAGIQGVGALASTVQVYKSAAHAAKSNEASGGRSGDEPAGSRQAAGRGRPRRAIATGEEGMRSTNRAVAARGGGACHTNCCPMRSQASSVDAGVSLSRSTMQDRLS